MITININDLARDMPVYLTRLNAGETVVLMQDDRPVAELKLIVPAADQLRPYALCAEEFTVPDDFDAPLPEAVLASFENA